MSSHVKRSSDEIMPKSKADHNEDNNYEYSIRVSEIEEEEQVVFDVIHKPSPAESMREFDRPVGSYSSCGGSGDDVVYVAVGRHSEETSKDALMWALNNVVVPSSTLVFLIHVFPEIKYIPTPLGKLPISQVNPEQKESYMAQETSKRREFLQKFLTLCSAIQVNVDTILIESEMEAKAILDLIPVLNIRKLVLGTTKSNLRRMRSRGGNGTTEQIMQSAPECCEVKIICEGKEMTEMALESPSPSLSPRGTTNPAPTFAPNQTSSSFSCGCFR